MGVTKGKWGTLLNALFEFKGIMTAIRRWNASFPVWRPNIRNAMQAWG